jgi:hypothetical protein
MQRSLPSLSSLCSVLFRSLIWFALSAPKGGATRISWLPFAFAFATNGIHYGYHVAAKAKAKVEQRSVRPFPKGKKGPRRPASRREAYEGLDGVSLRADKAPSLQSHRGGELGRESPRPFRRRSWGAKLSKSFAPALWSNQRQRERRGLVGLFSKPPPTRGSMAAPPLWGRAQRALSKRGHRGAGAKLSPLGRGVRAGFAGPTPQLRRRFSPTSSEGSKK